MIRREGLRLRSCGAIYKDATRPFFVRLRAFGIRFGDQSLPVRHEQMLAGYRTQDWAGARDALAECRRYTPELAGFYDLYAERIAYFEANPPGPDWNGVFVSETK